MKNNIKVLTKKQLRNLKEYIVAVEKEYAADSLKIMGEKGNEKQFMYSQGSYTTLKHVCELLGIDYCFCLK